MLLRRALLVSLLLLPLTALAAPDPMSAGRLTRLEVKVSSGDVVVTLAKTQHVRLNGPEGDARRKGTTLRIERDTEDVRVTVPPGLTVHVVSKSGDVTVTGDTKGLHIHTKAGDVGVRGSVQALHVQTASGGQRLSVGLSPNAQVQARSASGDVTVQLLNSTPVQVDAQAGGRVSGLESEPKPAAKLLLRSGSGDVRVHRARG